MSNPRSFVGLIVRTGPQRDVAVGRMEGQGHSPSRSGLVLGSWRLGELNGKYFNLDNIIPLLVQQRQS